MPTNPLSSSSRPGGGLSRLDGNKPTQVKGSANPTKIQPPSRPTAKVLPDPSGGSQPQSNPNGPKAKLFDPPDQSRATQKMDGKATQVMGFPSQKTELFPQSTPKPTQAQGTNRKNKKTKVGPAGKPDVFPSPSPNNNLPSLPGQLGGTLPSLTDGSSPSTVAPWDRPPLGGISPNQWGADDHFISNL